MILDKEYPATHSMSTSWFFADLDGNVALFDFNENGPVPTSVHEDCLPYMLYQNLDVTIIEGIPTARLTDEQIDSLLKDCKDDGCYEYLVEIDPNKVSVLVDALENKVLEVVIRLAVHRNLYWIEEYDDVSAGDLIRFENSGCIIKRYSLPDYTSVDKFEDGKLVFTNDFSSLPFYFYAQTYWPTEEAIRKVYNPTVMPLKVDQLNHETRDKISTLPIRFADSEYVQIAAYLPFDEREEFDDSVLDGYCKYPDEQGVIKYYHNGRTAFSKDAINFSDTPTAIIIADLKMRSYDMKESRTFVSMLGVYIPLKDLQTKSQMEELVKMYRPYVLILWSEAVERLRQWFDVMDRSIVINGETIKYFLNTETEKYRNQIEQLIHLPYRGVTIPKVLSEEDAKRLKKEEK